MNWGGGMKRYSPRWPYPDEPVTPLEHHALKAELVAMLVLLFVTGVCMFGEQLLDLLGIGVK